MPLYALKSNTLSPRFFQAKWIQSCCAIHGFLHQHTLLVWHYRLELTTVVDTQEARVGCSPSNSVKDTVSVSLLKIQVILVLVPRFSPYLHQHFSFVKYLSWYWLQWVLFRSGHSHSSVDGGCYQTRLCMLNDQFYRIVELLTSSLGCFRRTEGHTMDSSYPTSVRSRCVGTPRCEERRCDLLAN